MGLRLSLWNCLKTCWLMDIVSVDWGGYVRFVMPLTGMRDVCLRIGREKGSCKQCFCFVLRCGKNDPCKNVSKSKSIVIK